jgi:Vault protein inter-alpha-trypsin domain
MMQDLETKPELTWTHKFNLFAGVIMPAISISIEAITHICAGEFFDPIPTPWHLALVIFVPLAQLQVWFAIRRGAPERLKFAGLLNAAAIGISIFYSIVYVPLLPLAALFLIIGLGLLPLAPFLSLLASILMRRQLKQLAATAPRQSFTLKIPGLLAGIGLAIVALGMVELPASITRYGLQMAASNSAARRTEGIRFLRRHGNRDYMLRSCYGRTGRATDLVGYLFSIQSPVQPAQAQMIYYRVTGETFDTSIPPERIGGRLIPQETFDFDPDQGGATIPGKIKGLSLASSNLDGSVDGDGGVGYLEWTLIFQNESVRQREARAEVQLPPGAVVSRLTLWVDGEEREAAFAGRAKVKEAYQQIVRQRRDPVLVTTAGRDRILVQCFPVPPNRGEMKIRFGMTVPLVLVDKGEGRLLLPYFANRNFRIPDDFTHSVWIESQRPMSIDRPPLIPESHVRNLPHSAEHFYVVRGAMEDSKLSTPERSIRVDRSSAIGEMWSKNPFETGDFVVKQAIAERTPAHLQRIVLVVDTSAAMQSSVWEILAALRTLPPELEVKMVPADADGLLEGSSPQDVVADGVADIESKLHLSRFQGGADNALALSKAWELAAEKPGQNAIVWIHAPQLLQVLPIEALRQRWERRPYGPLLYSVRTSTRSDEIEKKLDGIDEVRSVVRLGSLYDDLEVLFGRLTGRLKTLEFVRSSQKLDQQTDLSGTYQSSEHLARLWANEEVSRILTARDDSSKDAAKTLAVRYQLVTPVSGAVVLETAQQYDAAGLKPVDAGTVPTIPEPEMIALLAVVAIFLSWLVYRQSRTKGRGQGGFPV